MKKGIDLAIYILLGVGLAANAYFMLSNGEPDKLWWWPLAVGFFAWAAVPFAAIAVINRFIAKDVSGKIILFVTALVVTCGGVYILIEAFITHLDAQSGIIFIFLPIYQCAAVALAVALLIVARILVKRKSRGNHRR